MKTYEQLKDFAENALGFDVSRVMDERDDTYVLLILESCPAKDDEKRSFMVSTRYVPDEDSHAAEDEAYTKLLQLLKDMMTNLVWGAQQFMKVQAQIKHMDTVKSKSSLALPSHLE